MATNKKGIEKRAESRECPKHGEVYYYYEASENYKCGVVAEMCFGMVVGVCGRKLGELE